MSVDCQLAALREHGHTAARLRASRYGGRPTKYRAQFAELAFAMLADPRTLASLSYVAMTFGIARSTFHDWMRRYPDFGEAVEMGKKAQECYLSTLLRKDSTQVNGTIFVLKNRHGWTDKKIHVNTDLDSISAAVLSAARPEKVDWLVH